jgi:hypothetical protein
VTATLKYIALSALALALGVGAAIAYPPLTVEDVTRTTITLGNLDCDTRYEIRVRERVGSRWRDAQTITRQTDACAPTPAPDADGDGVPDADDQCPNTPGPASNNGCPVPPPDGDGDGVPDAEDQCPNQPGPASNNGCPLPEPPAEYQTVPPDGGADYYGSFSNNLPTSEDYFPIGVWGAYNQTAQNRDLDAAAGINLYVWAADPAFFPEIRSDSRFRTFANYGQSGGGAEQAGWVLDDEIDMRVGPSGCSTIQQRHDSITDGRATYANYGKGIFPGWETDEQFRCFVEAQDLQSDDIYWFSDPNVCTSMSEGPTLFGLNRALTQAECRRAANYGYIVDRMRALDALDGERKPIWNFVEVSHPFTEAPPQSPNITDAQIRAAVWHSIIAGARGIIYFQHSFGPNQPCYGDHHTLRSDCHGHRDVVTDTNAQVKALAPVLNSPTVTSGMSASSSVKALGKLYNGSLYIFAGSRENVASMATFSVASGQTATVVGEGRSIAITNGRFTDSFANGNTIHIYRIG